MDQEEKRPVCMICGSRWHVLREGTVTLCCRCVEALGGALGEKLPGQAPVPRTLGEEKIALDL